MVKISSAFSGGRVLLVNFMWLLEFVFIFIFGYLESFGEIMVVM